MKLLFTTCLFSIVLFSLGSNQPIVVDSTKEQNICYVKSINDQVKIDGKIDESFWQTVPVITNMHQKWPVDTAFSDQQCFIQLASNGKVLYMAVKCMVPKPHILQNMQRDVELFNSDAFMVTLDPQNEHTSGYLFGTTAYGTQTEGIIDQQGDLNTAWDSKWYVETNRTATEWTAEFAIPLNTLRFPDHKTWGINFVHCDIKENLYSVWNKIPRTLSIVDLGYNGTMEWENLPTPNKGNFVLNPYLKAEALSDNESNTEAYQMDFGIDARISVTSTSNLDLTYNPDFSQVEVDQQQINLTQFQLLFPEKRNFFLENSDIFSQFGSWNVRPFYSRSLGLQNGEAVPITYGIRYTGNVNSKLRFGLLNVQTKATDYNDGKNNTMLALQQQIGKRSNIAFMASNAQKTDENKFVNDNYDRNIGGEITLNTPDNKWQSTSHVHFSTNQEKGNENQFLSILLHHRGEKFGAYVEGNSLGSDFRTAMGVSLRQWHYNAEDYTWHSQGYNKVWTEFYYQFFGKKNSKLAVHYPILENELVFYDELEGYRHHNFRWGFEFKNRSYLELGIKHETTRLLYPLSISSGENLEEGLYASNTSFIRHATDDRRKLYNYAMMETGSFYGGYKNTFQNIISLRLQPHFILGLDLRYDNIKLPNPYGSTELILAGLSGQISFNKNISWSNYLQYNTQAGNFNVNSRFRWRFTPMSDIHLILSNNYSEYPAIEQKNSNVVARVNYWLNF